MARGGKRRTYVEERGVWGRVMVALSKQCSFSKWPTRGHILLDDIEEGGVTSEMYDGQWVPKSRETGCMCWRERDTRLLHATGGGGRWVPSLSSRHVGIRESEGDMGRTIIISTTAEASAGVGIVSGIGLMSVVRSPLAGQDRLRDSNTATGGREKDNEGAGLGGSVSAGASGVGEGRERRWDQRYGEYPTPGGSGMGGRKQTLCSSKDYTTEQLPGSRQRV